MLRYTLHTDSGYSLDFTLLLCLWPVDCGVSKHVRGKSY